MPFTFSFSILKSILIIQICNVYPSIGHETKSSKPNVLFVVIDDLRPTLGCYDYDEAVLHTPNVDNLASKSILFEQAFVQQAICGPSRVSFLTSRRPDTTRLYDFYSYWRVHAGNFTTLPQHFKENGYITQSIGKVFHPDLASNYSDDSPYSWTNPPYHPSTEKYKMSKVCPNSGGSLGMNIVCPVELDQMPEGTLPDIQCADFAVEFLKNMTTEEKPFFLGVGFQKPHIPLKYPRDFLDLYPLSKIRLARHHTYPSRMPLVAWNPWTDLRERDDVQKLNISFPFGPVPADYQLLMRQSYYAATSYMDSQLGRVLSALEKYGFADNTIISFIGDHGWALGEHQEWSKYSLFDVAARVPMIIYIPGLTHTRQHQEETVFPFFNPLQYVHKEHIQPGTWSEPVSDEKLKFRSEHEMRNFIPEDNKQNIAGSLPDGVQQTGAQPTNAQQKAVQQKAVQQKAVQQKAVQQKAVQQKHVQEKGFKTTALVELVDLFPTLAELAGLPTLPLCPEDPFSTWLCTEGMSLVPLIENITKTHVPDFDPTIQRDKYLSTNTDETVNVKRFSSESYEKITIEKLASTCHPNFTSTMAVSNKWKKAVFSQYPRPSVEPREDSDKPHLRNIRIMGYSMWTQDFHYTEWVGFLPGNYSILWQDVYGQELYLRTLDTYEVHNMASFKHCYGLVRFLSDQLHKGWRAALPH